MSNSLNNKLNRINETLNIMKNNLGLQENEVIEDLAVATNLHSSINLFVQEEEPEKKEGIWIKTTGNFSDVIMENSPIVPEEWREADRIEMPGLTKQQASAHGYIYKDGYLYTYPNHKNTRVTRWNLKTMEQSTIGSMQYLNEAPIVYGMSFTENDEYLRILYKSGNILCHSFALNGTTTRIGTLSGINIACGGFSTYDGKFYFLQETGGYNIPLYSYDPVLNETKVAMTYFGDNIRNICVSGNVILGFSSVSGRHVAVDISNDFKSLSTANLDAYGSGINGNYSFIECGDNIYAVSKTGIHKINKETFSVELNVISTNFSSFVTMIACGDELYGISGVNDSPTYLIPISFESGEYENNSIVISQGQFTKTEKRTQLWDIVFKNRLLYSFHDAYYYDKEKGFVTGVPTYYGNGTEWIKFKN